MARSSRSPSTSTTTSTASSRSSPTRSRTSRTPASSAARGALAARAGNSADQALLLAALLRASLVQVRFATGPLSADAAERLMAATRLDLAAIQRHALAFMIGTADTSGDALPVPSADDVAAAVESLPADAAAILAAATDHLDSGLSTITGAFEQAGIALPNAFTLLPDRERTEHIWVQARRGAEWVDLDPSLPASAQPNPPPTIEATMDDLPDSLRHRVRFTVTGERIAGGELVQEATLEHDAFADELAGVPITFLNAKPEGLQGLGMALSSTLTGAVQYLSTLAVGDTSIVGLTPIGFGTPGGVLDVLGDDGSLEGESTGQWIDVRIEAVDRDPITVRREIFDRIGFVTRAEGAVDLAALPPVELVDLDAETPNEYLPCRTVVSFAVVGGAVNGSYFARDFARDDLFDNLAVVGAVHHYLREGLNAELASRRGVRGFCDAPNVVSYTVVPRTPVDGVDGDLPTSATVDIWHRSFGALAVAGTPAVAAPGIVVGVLSHVAERLTVGDGTFVDMATAGSPVGVGRLFEEAAAQGIDARVLASPLDPADIRPYGPEAQVRLALALDRGFVAIVPERPVTISGSPYVGWWLVDPSTGVTLDEFEDGRGVEMAEYDIPLTAEARAILHFRRLAACILKYGALASIILGAGGELAGYSGSGDVGSLLAWASSVASAAGQAPGVDFGPLC